MNYDCKVLANLLFPNVKETVEDLETAYTKETVMAQVISDMAVDFLVENAVAEEN